MNLHGYRHGIFSAIFALAGCTLLAQETGESSKPMARDAQRALEVATIKPARSDEPGGTFRVSPSGMFNATNFPVMVLIQFSYDVPRSQISGGPSWLQSERFDIVGKPDVEGAPSMNQVRMMLKKLLADRFQLSAHREKKVLAVYALTVAKGGPKLTESAGTPNGLPAFTGGGQRGRTVQNSTMAEFASDLQGTVPDRPIVDQTGLGSKRYDFVLKWTPLTVATNATADSSDAPPDIFTAIQEQLGLKLVPARAPADILVIDHVARPSEN